LSGEYNYTCNEFVHRRIYNAISWADDSKAEIPGRKTRKFRPGAISVRLWSFEEKG